jgi:hypothetical protein
MLKELVSQKLIGILPYGVFMNIAGRLTGRLTGRVRLVLVSAGALTEARLISMPLVTLATVVPISP